VNGAWRIATTLSVFLGWLCLVLQAASAHEVRPAYLDLKEISPGVFDVFFKTPMRGDARLSLAARFPGDVEALTPVVSRMTKDAMVQTWRIRALSPLAGQEVGIDGLESTMTDALVRVEYAAGDSWLGRLTPSAPSAVVPASESAWSVAKTYLALGIEHILLGIDHLLFVLGLMLLTANLRDLVKAITAFTLAHSITLAAATLGFVHMPPAPIEAAIALSIVFVAVEIVHARQGRIGIAARMPWLIAFAFGLLHGFGFAGALSEVGLPENHIPFALLFFNIGVEVGQLLFVATVFGLIFLLRSVWSRWPWWTRLVPPYAIGIMAMFWVFERVAAF
jgi:hydrogenase/urease accessory protein HupE